MEVVEGDDGLPPAKRINPNADQSREEKTEEEDDMPHADTRPFFFVRHILVFRNCCGAISLPTKTKQ